MVTSLKRCRLSSSIHQLSLSRFSIRSSPAEVNTPDVPPETQTGFVQSAEMIHVGSAAAEQISQSQKSGFRSNLLIKSQAEQLMPRKRKLTGHAVWLLRVSDGFLRLAVCRGVPLSERRRLRPHQRTVFLQDGLHRAELRAQ